jgi:hypothetical protein
MERADRGKDRIAVSRLNPDEDITGQLLGSGVQSVHLAVYGWEFGSM